MIILHSEHDKTSRDFVEKYGHGNTVLSYHESISTYNSIQGFPSVIVTVPAYYQQPENTVDPESGETIVVDGGNVEADIEIIFNPATLEEVQRYQDLVNQRAIDSPVQE